MEDIDEATLMASGGLHIKEIANELGVEPATVYQWLLSEGVLEQARDIRDGQIVDAYKGGQTIREICAEFGVSQGTVYNILHERNVELRRTHAPLSKDEKRAIVLMYRRGDLMHTIRQTTGRSLSAIYAVLDEYGIPRRRGLNPDDAAAVPIKPD